jgi:hypothetical protein
MVKQWKIGANIWSKKGLSESYLGVTAYEKNKGKKYVLTLELKRFPNPHKATNIRDQIETIIQEYSRI